MRIGLIDIEPKIFNTAYMQIATYHRAKGDTVDWWSPPTDQQFHHVYCSSLFDYTDKSEVPERTICGGTGFDVTSRLSQAIEKCDLDYSLYPNCKTTYLWFSRGCNRKCPWCVVPEKEGNIRIALPKNENPNGTYVTICDNNFFANKHWPFAIEFIKESPEWRVDFQGVDVRLLNKRRCDALNSLRHHKQIKIAWDNPRENLVPKLKQVIKWIKPYKLMCYVLIGYSSTPEEDLHRVETLRELKIDPFAMPYNKHDRYQKDFARWVNKKQIFKTVEWKDYKARKL